MKMHWRSAALALLGLVVLGCANKSNQTTESDTTASVAPSAAPVSLDGTKWRLVDLGGAGVVAKAEATLDFADSGRVAGKGSCNRFFGTATISGESIHFGPIGATKMACLDTSVSRQEANYFKALEAAERITREDTTLSIYYADSDQPLRFMLRTD